MLEVLKKPTLLLPPLYNPSKWSEVTNIFNGNRQFVVCKKKKPVSNIRRGFYLKTTKLRITRVEVDRGKN